MRTCFFLLMPLIFRTFFAALVLAFGLVPERAHGQQEATTQDSSPFSSAALLSASRWVEPGEPLALGVQLVMEEGWHSYWENPGDAGEPTEIAWRLPSGFTVSEVQWPIPEKIDGGPLRSYGYSDEVVLLAEVTPPDDLVPGSTAELAATASWLICADVCLFAEEEVALSLPVRSSPAMVAAPPAAIERARARVPVALPGWRVEAKAYANSFALSILPPVGTVADLEDAYFFPADLMVLEHAAAQPVTRDGDTFLMALQQSKYAEGTPTRLRGVLVAGPGRVLDADRQYRALAVDVPLEAGAVAADQSAGSGPLPLLVVLLLALGGGLLLNLMPCVFPILSIKVLGFVQYGRLEAAQVRRHGLTFALGVIVSFLVLAAALLMLRAAGNQVGWGFQLQSPSFVAGMAFLFFAFGLSLLGVFELGASAPRWAAGALGNGAGYRRSFLDGALATLVATPCTAPFMGAALGAAIVMPTAIALLVFAFLGIGMALPYIVLTWVPGLMAKLPRPGPWMVTLKHALAFPMIATSIWLAWVLGNQVGVDGMALLLVGLLLLGVALWVLGRWPGVRVSGRVRIVTRIAAGLAFVMAFTAAYQGVQLPAAPASGLTTSDQQWQPFSAASVDALSAEGRPVFVDFTAAWCLTCQVNKRTTLGSSAVRAAFAEKGVTLMRADWTSRNDAITRALASHGRNGVPLYVLYPGGDGEPALLPEVLTESIVLSALKSLPDRIAATSPTSL